MCSAIIYIALTAMYMYVLLMQGQTTDALSKLLSLQPSDAVLLTYEDGNLVKYVIIKKVVQSLPINRSR